MEAVKRLGTYDALSRDRDALRDLADARALLIVNLMTENRGLSNQVAMLAGIAEQERLASAARQKRERVVWACACGAALVVGVILGTVLKK